MDGWVDGWMDGWLGGCNDVCMHGNIYHDNSYIPAI